MPYASAGRRTVLVLEFAHLWAIIQAMPGDQVATSTELFRFNLFARENPELAELAKLVQFSTFDKVNAL